MRKKTLALFLTCVLAAGMLAGCGNKDSKDNNQVENSQGTESAKDDQAAADEVAKLIDAIYVQERNDNTDEQCAAAKEAWDKLTDAQKALVSGENADPDYFGRDTGDASKDDPLNQDNIGDNEILVVSFGTSFNDSRVADISGVEKAIQAANPDWAVRRAFTAQIIINHVQARDGEKIDNVDQALQRAVDNGVKNLVIQPTHLMHGAEYDELVGELDAYKDKFEKVVVAEPLLGEVGDDATVINDDKKAVAEDITAEAVKTAGYDSLDAAKKDGTAFVFMGHGTSHSAKVSYSQMSTQMDKLGYDNVFIGTVEGNVLGWCFLDWSLELNKQAGAQGVLLYAMQSAIAIAQELRENRDAECLKGTYEVYRKAAKAYFYDEKKGLFVSGENRQISYASQVWLILGGVVDSEEGLRILHNVAADREALEMVTPYMYHYYIEALLKCNADEEALAVLTEYWGGMARLGADTFWELYNPKNPDESPYGGTIVNSYCHAWSCAPAYFLRKYFGEN